MEMHKLDLEHTRLGSRQQFTDRPIMGKKESPQRLTGPRVLKITLERRVLLKRDGRAANKGRERKYGITAASKKYPKEIQENFQSSDQSESF